MSRKQPTPKWTPGPWKVEVLGDQLRVTKVEFDFDNDDIAGIGDCRSEENQATAALIAAAPELYESLEACVFALGRTGANVAGGPNRKEWEQARAALAKATQA